MIPAVVTVYVTVLAMPAVSVPVCVPTDTVFVPGVAAAVVIAALRCAVPAL